MAVAVKQANGSTALGLRVSMSEAVVAHFSTPASCPAKRAFFPVKGYRPDSPLDGGVIGLDTADSLFSASC